MMWLSVLNVNFSIDTPSDVWISRALAIRILALLFLVLALSSSGTSLAQQPTAGNKIVILFESSTLTPWKMGFIDGLHDYLNNSQADFSNLRIAYEFLGLTANSSGTRPDVIINMLKYRQQIDPAELVLAALAPAVDFVHTFGDEIYPGASRIYLAPSADIVDSVNDLNLQDIELLLGNSNIAIEKTLTVIPQILPETQHLYMVSGSDELSSAFLDDAERILNDLSSFLEIHYLTGLPVDELRPITDELPENSAILMLSYSLDRNGTILRQNDVLNFIVETSNAPIFTPFDSAYVEGVTGGNFSSSEMSGRGAGEMVVALLSGSETESMPFAPTAYMFDQRQLQRWGISESLLPPSSIIANQQPTFSQLYGWQLLILLTVVSTLLAFLYILNRRKIEFQTLWESTADSMITLNSAGIITSVNPKTNEMFAYHSKELIGQSIEILVPEDRRTSHSQLRTKFQANSSNREMGKGLELEGLRKHGAKFPVEISLKPILIQGESLVLAEIQDISKRKMVEEQLRQSQKLEAVGQFSAGVAHDLNNILTAIMGFTDLLKLQVGRGEGFKDLEQISKAGERAKSLIGKILAFSRQQVLAPKLLNVNDVVRDLEGMLQQLTNDDIELNLLLDSSLSSVQFDPVQLEQIITNLVVNSSDAMPDGGNIVITTSNLKLDEESLLAYRMENPGHYVELSISDSGTGMEPETLARIFDPFFTTKERGKGIGLGLSSTYGAVKQGKGGIMVFSEPGVGTTFKVYFPVVDSQILAPQKTPVNPAKSVGSRKILLVEDDEGVRMLAKRMLESNGYVIFDYESAEEALESIKKLDSIDLVLTDIVLLGMSGPEMAEELKLSYPNLTVMFMSGFAGKALEYINELEDGAHFLHKPFTRELLLQKVDQQMQ